MTWKVFDLIVDGIINIKNKIIDVNDKNHVTIDGKEVPVLGDGDFSKKQLFINSENIIVPGDNIINQMVTPVIKTVAADGEEHPENYDFASLEEAMIYAESVDYFPGAWLFLSLADGTHYFERDPHVPNAGGNTQGAYNLNHCNIGLYGTGESSCTVALKPGVSSGSGLIIRAANSRLSFTNMTVNLNPDGNETHDTSFLLYDICYTYLHDITVNGVAKGKGFAFDSRTNSVLFGDVKIRKFKAPFGYFIPSIFASIDVDECSWGILSVNWIPNLGILQSITFGPDVDNPFNSGGEQLDPGEFGSSLIYGGTQDGKKHRFFGNWAGPSNKRPTNLTKAVGQPYFDTELGKPIWYNGTQWVDATGTAV